jgi:hypothetical protein
VLEIDLETLSTPQFVYPFTLEPHILAQAPSIHERIRTQRSENEKIIADRLDQAKREKYVSHIICLVVSLDLSPSADRLPLLMTGLKN